MLVLSLNTSQDPIIFTFTTITVVQAIIIPWLNKPNSFQSGLSGSASPNLGPDYWWHSSQNVPVKYISQAMLFSLSKLSMTPILQWLARSYIKTLTTSLSSSPIILHLAHSSSDTVGLPIIQLLQTHCDLCLQCCSLCWPHGSLSQLQIFCSNVTF